ncbi:MAG: LPS export ABC transporter periplasmic protein LptC [Rhodobacteraceae bacterium]|nr:LPS export ABC transporter periplasmic protein LptC [Paracoccaceae bacterium]
MANPDLHTRLIGWLKIALPLMALAILSTLFLVARTIDPEDAIPYASVDVADRLREPRMTAPTYAGVTSDGAALTVSADEARPGTAKSGGAGATKVFAVLETPDGARNELTAAAAQIDDGARVVSFSGDVTISSSAGWTVRSDEMLASMDVTNVSAPTPVTATGPGSTVTANSMRLTENPSSPDQYLLVFNGAVKLIYRPAN